jgi:hypothetical protein
MLQDFVARICYGRRIGRFGAYDRPDTHSQLPNLRHARQPMNNEECNQKLELHRSAVEYLASKMANREKDCYTSYPLNRGDILILVMLIDRELAIASSDWTDPLNAKRLTAMREKLGNIAIDAPQMSSAEAQQFRE